MVKDKLRNEKKRNVEVEDVQADGQHDVPEVTLAWYSKMVNFRGVPSVLWGCLL